MFFYIKNWYKNNDWYKKWFKNNDIMIIINNLIKYDFWKYSNFLAKQ